MIAAVIIVAAGSSTRMGMGRKKEYLALSGKPVIQHTCEAFLSSERFHYMCIVAPPSGIGTARRILGPFLQRATAMYSVNAAGGTGDSAGHSAADDAGPVQLAVSFTEGGATRQQSVLNGLRALEPHVPGFQPTVFVPFWIKLQYTVHVHRLSFLRMQSNGSMRTDLFQIIFPERTPSEYRPLRVFGFGISFRPTKLLRWTDGSILMIRKFIPGMLSLFLRLPVKRRTGKLHTPMILAQAHYSRIRYEK